MDMDVCGDNSSSEGIILSEVTKFRPSDRPLDTLDTLE